MAKKISHTPILIPTEHQEQCALIKWAELMINTKLIPELEYLIAIPNGGVRGWQTGKKLKEEGVKPGVPDLLWPLKCYLYSGLFIEMKRQVGGVVSEEQKKWIEWLRSQGFQVVICKGEEQARKVIVQYYSFRRDKEISCN